MWLQKASPTESMKAKDDAFFASNSPNKQVVDSTVRTSSAFFPPARYIYRRLRGLLFEGWWLTWVWWWCRSSGSGR